MTPGSSQMITAQTGRAFATCSTDFLPTVSTLFASRCGLRTKGLTGPTPLIQQNQISSPTHVLNATRYQRISCMFSRTHTCSLTHWWTERTWTITSSTSRSTTRPHMMGASTSKTWTTSTTQSGSSATWPTPITKLTSCLLSAQHRQQWRWTNKAVIRWPTGRLCLKSRY